MRITQAEGGGSDREHPGFTVICAAGNHPGEEDSSQRVVSAGHVRLITSKVAQAQANSEQVLL